MVELRWPRNSYFTDRERDEQYDGPGTFDVPEDAVGQYLDRGWERVDDDSEDETEDGSEDEDYDNPPSDRDTLEEMSYDQLRKYAAESDRDDIDGGSKKQDIIDAFAANED